MAVSWLKKGTDAKKQIDQAEKEAAIKAEQNKKMWRFYLKPGEEAPVTFIDGNLDKAGLLDIPIYKEHQIFMNGSWQNWFVCTAEQEPCPVCETASDAPALIGMLTVMDHRTAKSKDGTKTYVNQVRLFPAKRDTIKRLQNMAGKRGGLAGCKFDILRTGEKTAAVGDQFDFVDKTPIAELKKKYTGKNAEGKVVCFFEPADYEKEIIYRTAKELRALGFGNGNVPIGAEEPPTDGPDKGQPDYADQL